MRNRLRIRSLPARIAVFSSLVGSLCVLSTALVFGAIQKKQIEAQVVQEGIHYAERFTTWTLGYFYQQDNLLHLETQQRFLSESPNIVYSYIVKGSGEIDVGIDGINSPDIGARKLEWEEPLPLKFDGSVSVKFRANEAMAAKFKEKVRKGEEVLLVGFPVSCPERETPCAQLRVALVPQTARGIAGRLTAALLAFGLLAATLSGIAVFVTARRQVQPLRRITRLMERAKEGGDAAVETVRANFGESDTKESTEISSLRASLSAYLDTLEIAASHEAVARTTQALAHDVRKPFSMLNAIIHSVEAAESDADARRFLVEALPEVRQAVASVEGLILDVMQIGSTTPPLLEDAAPEALVASALTESFRVHPRAEVEITYDFRHRHLVRVDTVRVGRVFGNLLDNAIQAMGAGGRLWIWTRELPGFVEFCIGNSGSFIAEEHTARLFEEFFTHGKRGGTGLGLAVAKRIILQHGGTIQCRSVRTPEKPEGVVEFVFTVPVSTTVAVPPSLPLPGSGADFRDKSLSSTGHRSLLEEQARADEGERNLLRALGVHGCMDVLLVDDEAVYRNGLVALVQRSTNLAGRVNVRCARDANEALAAVAEAQRPPDLLIQDVDLGPASQDGFEVVRELRKRGFRGFVCVHSNRFLSTHDASAQEAGADDVIPKPMSRAQLLALLSNIAQKSAEAAAAGAGGVAGTRAEGEAPAHAQVRASSVADAPLPEIAYIDDALSFLVGMRVKVKGKAILHEFRSPTEFLARMEAETDFIGTLACIVTDFHFASDEPLDGLAFARRLRARGYSRPIVLASGTVQEFAPDEANTFSGRVDKPLGDWAQLEPWTRG